MREWAWPGASLPVWGGVTLERGGVKGGATRLEGVVRADLPCIGRGRART